jgi:hypothetical protein
VVNGERVGRAVLRDGDLLHFGGVAARSRVSISSMPLPTRGEGAS